MAYAEANARAEMDTLFSSLGGKAPELEHAINAALQDIPFPFDILADIQAKWDEFIKAWKEFWDMVDHVRANMGSPSNLWRTGDAWSARIGGPVSAKAQLGKAGSLAVDDNWDGTAADAYRQKLLLQEAPMEKMKSTYSDGISTALSSAATGIIMFWASLITAVTALILGLIVAIALAPTVLGAILAALSALATAIWAVNAGLMVLSASMSGANSTLQQKLADNAGYLDGHWPRFVTG
jgi:hypothetical protein